MPLVHSYPSHVPDTVILAQEENTNNAETRDWADTHEAAVTGVHGVGAGTVVGTENDNIFNGDNTFNGLVNFTQGANFNLTIPELISNARFSYTAGVLRLVGENGVAPSASNPIYIRYWEAGTGRWVTAIFTTQTNCTIGDSSSADSGFYNGVNGTPFGTTSGLAWGNEMPLFIYLGLCSTGPVLFLSRLPNLYIAPGSIPAYVGYANNPPSDTSNLSVICMTSVNPGTLSGQCQLIGYIGATKNTNNDWQFFTPTTIPYGGLGNYSFEKIYYSMVPGHFGAGAGTYFQSNGGLTYPTYTANYIYRYNITRTGIVSCKVFFSNTVGGTPGAGAFALSIVMPFPYTGGLDAYGTGTAVVGNGTNLVDCNILVQNPNASIKYNHITALGAGFANVTRANVLGDDQNNVARGITAFFISKI